MHKIVVAITGASGSIYAQRLLEKLAALPTGSVEVGVVLSRNAADVWQHELGNDAYMRLPFRLWDRTDFRAPFASGTTALLEEVFFVMIISSLVFV